MRAQGKGGEHAYCAAGFEEGNRFASGSHRNGSFRNHSYRDNGSSSERIDDGVQQNERGGRGRGARGDARDRSRGHCQDNGFERGCNRSSDFSGNGERSFGNMRPSDVRIEGVIDKVSSYGGRISFGGSDTCPPEAIQFNERSSSHNDNRLQEGDVVSFSVGEDVGGKGMKGTGRMARNVTLVKGRGGRPRLEGMVSSIKDKFGFIRQPADPVDLFFHISAVPKGVDLKVGDEVEFCKFTDQRSKKEAATQLQLLPKGTVKFEVPLPERHLGVVVTALSAQAFAERRLETRADKLALGGAVRLCQENAVTGSSSQGRQLLAATAGDGASSIADGVNSISLKTLQCLAGANDHGEEQDTSVAASTIGGAEAALAASEDQEAVKLAALVESLPSSAVGMIKETERLGFGLDDVAEPWRDEGLYIGDKVEFRVAAELSGAGRGATELRLVDAAWHKGFVVYTKDAYGFIRPETEPVGSSRQFFFPFSCLPASLDSRPRVGDEVKFRILSDGKGRDSRLSAGMVRPLPPGSIVCAWLLPEWWRATVKAHTPRRQQQGQYASRSGVTQDARSSAVLERLLQEEEEPDGAPPPATRASLGEVVYTSKWTGPAHTGEEPTVVTGQPSGAAMAVIEKLWCGEGLPSQPLSFGPEQLCDRRRTLGDGDVVAVQLSVSEISGHIQIARVRVLQEAEIPKERGVVVVLKDNFGFLRCETREGQLFFHYAELEGVDRGRPPIRTGDEFEYELGVDERTGKACAQRLKAIARGTARFDDKLVEGRRGVVVRLNVEKGSGEILADELYEQAVCRVPFTRHAVLVPMRGYLPPPGGAVTFTLGRQRAKGLLVALDVRSVVQRGFVDRLLPSGKGLLRTTEPLLAPIAHEESLEQGEPVTKAEDWRAGREAAVSLVEEPARSEACESSNPAMLPRRWWPSSAMAADEVSSATLEGTPLEAVGPETARAHASPSSSTGVALHTVIFFSNEVEREAQLATGDEVDFVLGVHPKNGELSARDIHLIKEAPRAPERTEWIRREIDSSKLTRYSKGPDGTKGFTLGRGTHLNASKDSSAF